jgi:hypothetical protein
MDSPIIKTNTAADFEHRMSIRYNIKPETAEKPIDLLDLGTSMHENTIYCKSFM